MDIKQAAGPVDYLSINIGRIWRELRRQPLYFWCFCGYLFFEYVRPQSIYTAIDFLPWTKLLILGAFVLRALSPEPKSLGGPLAFTNIGFFFVATLSSLFAVFPSVSFNAYTALVNWLILYILSVWIVTTRFRLFIVVLLLALASFKMAQHAALSWASRGFTFARWGVAGTPGFFGNAADLGVQMLIFIPLSIAIIVGGYQYWQGSKIKKAFFFFFPISGVMAVLATGQRNTLLGLIAMGLVVALVAKKKVRNAFLIAIAGGLIFLAMPQEYKDRFQSAGTDNTSVSRLHYWKRGVEMYQDHPWLGIGYTNWVPYYASRYPGESLRKGKQEVAHSTPFTVLAELGTLGVLFYYGIVLKVLITNARSIRMARSLNYVFEGALAFALSIGLVGFLVSSTFLSIAYYPFLFMQASLTAALFNILKKESSVK